MPRVKFPESYTDDLGKGLRDMAGFFMVSSGIKSGWLRRGIRLAGIWRATEAVYHHVGKTVAFRQAKAYASGRGKPVLNVGCGSDPRGDVNVDIVPQEVQNFQLADICALPFADKEFASVVASHVVEHVQDPWAALDECTRVGERVWVLTPHPLTLGAWLVPGHRWVFLKGHRFIRWNPVWGWAVVGLALKQLKG